MKKSQFSLEFLMTYGWALLVISITISALLYFSVVEPTSFINPRCLAEYGFECTEFSVNIQPKTNVHIIAENQVGLPIKVNNISIETTEGISDCVLSDLYIKNSTGTYDISINKVRVGATENFHILMNCSSGTISKNSVIKSEFKLEYRPDKDNYFKKNSNFEFVGVIS
ncbi:MAG: hypothetical protein ACQER9_03495 [Nanobdellota archaeon]